MPTVLNQRFLPVTDDVVRCHLSGKDDYGRDFVMGVYPMLLDETCFFLAADFDKTTWTEDARAILETCERLHLPAALERSRSGNGGHVWIFFDEPVPASLARKLGAHILTETMERRPDIGLDSYDRFFLYRRLETLPETARRFRLNAELPIPFDGWGRMEVDLLDADAHIAIELDGGQHLDNAEAYRRDRRKDVLLQENGFHVLRFLCEDVGKRLDEVLDAIVRALSHRAQQRGKEQSEWSNSIESRRTLLG